MILHHIDWSLSLRTVLYCFVLSLSESNGAKSRCSICYVDKAGFKLDSKTRGHGRNITGHRTIINIPEQCGGNIIMYLAIRQKNILHHHAILGPYNTAHNITFLDTLHNTLMPNDQGPEQPMCIIIWDNVSFHQTAVVNNWFTGHLLFMALNLPHILQSWIPLRRVYDH